MSSRARPFSGKKKKQQLQERRQRKAHPENTLPTTIAATPNSTTRKTKYSLFTVSPNQLSKLVSDWVPRDNEAFLIKCMENPLYMSALRASESSSTAVNIAEFYTSTSMPIPTRPSWTSDMTKDQLDESEFRYHEQWLKEIYASDCHLGFFEHNLEVWRQFWRVCEVSDVIVVVLDIRFPLLHYPLSLHRYLETLKKPIICTLMKCDLVDPKLVEFWKTSMRSYFGEALVLVETSVYDMIDTTAAVKNPRRYRDSLGVQELLNLCKLAVDNKNDTEWDMISRQKSSGTKLDESMPATETSYVTIGMLGHPNVGKSSLINSIVGHKVVSASKTPGHTKHFQTIHLTKNIRLCDCPGLIFPVSLSRELQVLNGLFNVAQLRDPFGPILAATMLINVPKSLSLTLPPEEREWSVLLICESFATQKGFFTSKAGRPDVHRAANLLLRMILDGRVLIAWHPDSYSGPIARILVYGDGADSESESQESSTSSNDDRLLQANRFLSLVDDE